MSSSVAFAGVLASTPGFAPTFPPLAEEYEDSLLSSDLKDAFLVHVEEVRRFAQQRVGTQEAEDLLQEVCLHILERNSPDPVAHPRAYIFRVAANLSVDLARKTKSQLSFYDPSAQDAENLISPERSIVCALQLRRLESALAELPSENRTAFLLNRIEELTFVEIGERMGLSSRTVERYVNKAENMLREKIE
ncbi:MAG TPA: sigma-70 family RNA polymerase sigma factor [Methylocystis sp.]|nr:sigma-70 family RNA polymerase sigma factor [Methylocystis sp.]